MSRSYRPQPADLAVRSRPQMREYEAIADRIASEVAGPALDWGCGLGQVTDLLLRRGVEVTAFDDRPDRIDDGLERLSRFPEIEAHVSRDPVKLPFENGSFAAVLSLGVLEHVAFPDDSLDELRHVMWPGGTLYVFKLPNRRSWLEWLARRLGRYHHGAVEHKRLYDVGSARAIVERHGFTVRELRRSTMLPLTLTRPGRRLADAIWRANRALARVPVLNMLATNVELVATRT